MFSMGITRSSPCSRYIQHIDMQRNSKFGLLHTFVLKWFSNHVLDLNHVLDMIGESQHVCVCQKYPRQTIPKLLPKVKTKHLRFPWAKCCDSFQRIHQLVSFAQFNWQRSWLSLLSSPDTTWKKWLRQQATGQRNSFDTLQHKVSHKEWLTRESGRLLSSHTYLCGEYEAGIFNPGRPQGNDQALKTMRESI